MKDKITLETESYLIIGKENQRFFPFLELEFNEVVIYEMISQNII